MHRKRIVEVFASLCLLCFAALTAAPDPDIFDGSLQSPSLDGNSGGTPASTSRQDTGTPASNQPSYQPISEKTVESATMQEGGDSIAEAAKAEGSTSGPAGNGASASGGSGLSAERSFEGFGFGGSSGEEAQALPENSSKISPHESISQSTGDLPETPPGHSGSGGQSGSDAAKSKPKGDYGTNLPPGI